MDSSVDRVGSTGLRQFRVVVGELWKRFDRRSRVRVLASLGAVLVASVLTALLPLIVGRVIDRVLRLDKPTLFAMAPVLLVLAGVTVLVQIATVVRKQLAEYVATAFERDLRIDAYHALVYAPLARVDGKRTGAIYGNTSRSIDGSVKLFKLLFLDVLPTLSLAVFAVLVAFTKSWQVGLAIFGVLPTGLVLVVAQIRNQSGVRVTLRDHKDDIDGRVVELLPARDAIRTFGAESHFLRQVRAACDRLRQTEFAHHRAMSLFDAIKALNEGVWLIAVILVATLVSGPDLSAGALTTYALLYLGILAPLRELHRVLDELSESSVQAADMVRLLTRPQDEAYVASQEGPAVRPGDPQLLLRFANVGLAYASGTVALDGVSFDIRRGTSVGIVGPSGSGKSTLARLIVRLAHGYTGSIAFDGREITSYTAGDLASLVTYIGQDPRIFNASVLENIDLGRGFDRQRVEEAARRAAIDAEIRRLRDGYDEVIEERGDTLSGGQKQRICLARALLADPKILLLDEPTAALDTSSESEVQRAIDRIDGVTKIVIAHRLSTLVSSDEILVLVEGKVVQHGAFKALANQGGTFQTLLSEQRKMFE